MQSKFFLYLFLQSACSLQCAEGQQFDPLGSYEATSHFTLATLEMSLRSAKSGLPLLQVTA